MNIKKAKEEIKYAIQAYLAKDEFGEYRIPAGRQRPVLLMGAPGIGKTAVMEQVARECGVALVSYSITHHTRQSAIGLPFISKKEYGGKEYTVTEYTMSEIIASVYDKMEETGLQEGILFIDEIHKYKDWSKELKLIYDYHSELNIVFTGSSVLDINKGASDLSRRAVMYQMQGLSFREYLYLSHRIYSLQDIVAHKVEIPGLEHPLPLFHDYLQKGYYPFALEEDFDIRLRQIINLTLESDIPQFADMNVSTGRKLKQLLAIIAKSVPFKPNFSSIAKILEVSRNNISDYCLYIEEAGLIAQLRDATGGIRGLGKVDKIYLDNTNLIYSLAQDNSNIGNIRETFFLNQTRIFSDVVASPVSDFLIDDMTFEVGGKKKGQKQIQEVQKGFVVKDDIERGFMNVVPLWQFGMGY